MSHWWKYPLADVLPFSIESYYWLLASYADIMWPTPLAGHALGLLLLFWMIKGRTGQAIRILPAVLGAAWLATAWFYFETHLSTLFWAAPAFAAAFAIQGGLLLLSAIAAPPALASLPRRQPAAALAAIAVIGYATAAIVPGLGSRPSEAFGLFPDPTALTTLAILAGCAGYLRWLLMLFPLIWGLASCVILTTIGDMEGFVPALFVTGSLAIALWPSRTSPGGPSKPETTG